MRTTLHRECNASYDPATDRYVGSFAPTEPGTVVRIHTPVCVRAGRDVPTVIDVTHYDNDPINPGVVFGQRQAWAINAASSVDTSVSLAGMWMFSMARPPTPEFDAASVPVGLRVTFEVET